MEQTGCSDRVVVLFAFNKHKSINLNNQRGDASRMITNMMKVVLAESEQDGDAVTLNLRKNA